MYLLTAVKLLCFSILGNEQELKLILQSCSEILVQLKLLKKLSLSTMGQDLILCVEMVQTVLSYNHPKV